MAMSIKFSRKQEPDSRPASAAAEANRWKVSIFGGSDITHPIEFRESESSSKPTANSTLAEPDQHRISVQHRTTLNSWVHTFDIEKG